MPKIKTIPFKYSKKNEFGETVSFLSDFEYFPPLFCIGDTIAFLSVGTKSNLIFDVIKQITSSINLENNSIDYVYVTNVGFNILESKIIYDIDNCSLKNLTSFILKKSGIYVVDIIKYF